MLGLSRVAASCLILAVALELLVGAADRDDLDGLRPLPMNDMPSVALAASIPDVVADAPLHTFRVGRVSRSARVVKAPARLTRTVTVPRSGGYFATTISPAAQPVRITVAVEGLAPVTVAAQPERWNVVRADLPTTTRPVRIVETLDAPRDTVVLWGDDVVVPNRRSGRAPDVIVLSLDTVRPDYLTPYTPGTSTTPVLAQFARESMRFDQAISVSSWTTPAHAALFTGQYPRPGLGVTERFDAAQVTLAEILAAAGYNTQGASGGPCIDSVFGFQQGFRAYRDSAEPKNALAMTNWAINRVKATAPGAPFFLFLNYFDAHEVNSGVTSAEWEAAERGTVRLDGAPLEHLRAGYRFDLQTIDRQVGRLFEALRQTRDWDNTIVVVLGDHGQLLGERGFVGHGFSLDEELIRIPLIVKGTASSRFAGRRYQEQFQMTDVFSLILELAGLRRPAGPSIVERVAAGEPVRTLTFAQYHLAPGPEVTAMRRWTSQTLEAVRTDSIKVIRDAEGRITTYRVGDRVQSVVPRFALTERLLGELDRFRAQTATTAAGERLVLPKDVVDRLRALGYIR